MQRGEGNPMPECIDNAMASHVPDSPDLSRLLSDISIMSRLGWHVKSFTNTELGSTVIKWLLTEFVLLH